LGWWPPDALTKKSFASIRIWKLRTLPKRSPTDVRRGGSSLAHVLAECTDLELRLSALLQSSPLPPQPDINSVECYVMDTYAAAWAEQQV
jgi:hypothetical protein